MKMLCIILIFCYWLHYFIRKASKNDQQRSSNLWEREYNANFVRKSGTLDYNTDLEFITIPLEHLPFMATQDNTLISYQNQVKSLADQQIANLSAFTNTDLKYKYGTASITELTKIDENYTILTRTISQWGKYLYEQNYLEEAKTVLEYGISIHTEVSANYKTLAMIYKQEHQEASIYQLIAECDMMSSLMKTSLQKSLKEIANA